MADPWNGKTKHSVARKTICAHGHAHASRRESRRCDELHLLERGEQIAGLKVHPEYKFWINGTAVMMENNQAAGYTADFSYVDMRDGMMVVEDVKPRSKKADSRDWALRKAIFKHLNPSVQLREVRT